MKVLVDQIFELLNITNHPPPKKKYLVILLFGQEKNNLPENKMHALRNLPIRKKCTLTLVNYPKIPAIEIEKKLRQNDHVKADIILAQDASQQYHKRSLT